MTIDIEKLAKKLTEIHDALPACLRNRYEYPMERIARHVARLILEARREELGAIEKNRWMYLVKRGDYFMERMREINAELETLKEKK